MLPAFGVTGNTHTLAYTPTCTRRVSRVVCKPRMGMLGQGKLPKEACREACTFADVPKDGDWAFLAKAVSAADSLVLPNTIPGGLEDHDLTRDTQGNAH
jgi:hypothetical protein